VARSSRRYRARCRARGTSAATIGRPPRSDGSPLTYAASFSLALMGQLRVIVYSVTRETDSGLHRQLRYFDSRCGASLSRLRTGANACVVQPWSVLEMQERMLALRRGSRVHAGTPLVRLDPLTRDLMEGVRRLPLTTCEYLLVECLLRKPNAPVPRDQMICYVWPEKDDIDASTVNLIVSRLRRRLELHAIEVRIETIGRFGYQLRVPSSFVCSAPEPGLTPR